MYQITVSDVQVDVVRKDIKNLHLAVYPPDGRVRIAVPLHTTDDSIRLAVIDKLGWVKKQQEKFRTQERQTQRHFISGESHYFKGQRYLLKIIEQGRTPSVSIQAGRLVLTVRPESGVEQRRRVLSEWYRDELKQTIPPFIEKWEPRLDVTVDDWRVKQMKTKWGTCNAQAKRIWLNLELIKKPVACVEYIIVHEMVHLLVRNHNDAFLHLMDHHLPNWRLLRDELNREPLAYEEWDY